MNIILVQTFPLAIAFQKSLTWRMNVICHVSHLSAAAHLSKISARWLAHFSGIHKC